MKKAQIRMFESIAVLILFFFLVAIGLGFYGNIQQAQMEQSRDQLLNLRTIKIANMVAGMPELSCTQEGVKTSACVDFIKAEQMASTPFQATLLDYIEFDNAKIELYEFIEDDFEPVVTILDRAPTEFRAAIPSRVPVTIYRPVPGSSHGTYDFGYLEVTTYR
ncbi:MAG: hypothetical protein ACMXYF_00640 [Candidatus Woesearchaeota archaeon]